MRLLAAPAATTLRSTTADDAAPTVTRRRGWPPAHRAQLPLLLASAAMIIASFMPWVVTGFGTYRGVVGPGLWTFYGGIFGIAGALVPSRRLALGHAIATAAAGIGLPLWQLQRLLAQVGLDGWSPGFGMAVAFIAGVVAARSAVQLYSAGRVGAVAPGTVAVRGDGGSRRNG